MQLESFIEKHFKGSKAGFAAAQGVKVQQVYKWLKEPDLLVIDGQLYRAAKVEKFETK